MRNCPKHGGPYPCKQCARDRKAGKPQKPAQPVQQPTAAQVRAAQQNILPTWRAVSDFVRHHQKMAEEDARNAPKECLRKLYAILDRPSLRKKYGLSRRDVADLLKNPALSEGLKRHEVKYLRDLGYKNTTVEKLAAQLGTDVAGLELILEPLEALVIGNARARKVKLVHVPDDTDIEYDFIKTQNADEAEVTAGLQRHFNPSEDQYDGTPDERD